jgi:hypothetical protein
MLCESLWCQSAGSERTDLAAEVSLGLYCGVALRFHRLHQWNQGIKLLRLALAYEFAPFRQTHMTIHIGGLMFGALHQ